MSAIRELQRQIRETKADMRRQGIKRSSFMNGGHTPDSYRLNARLFTLTTQLQHARREADRDRLG
jgi:hypothetical protein